MLETHSIRLLPLTRILISASMATLSGKVMELIRIGREKTFRSGVVSANHLSRLISSVKTVSLNRTSALEASKQSLITPTVNPLNNWTVFISFSTPSLN